MFAQLTIPAPGEVGLAFTDRHGGVSTGECASLNLGRADLDSSKRLRENLRRVTGPLGINRVCALDQVHGSAVYRPGPGGWAGDAWQGNAAGQPRLPVADAAVSTQRGLALMIRIADCVPVLFADAQAGVIGAAHAGRAGLFAGVLQATIEAMREAGASQITAWVGPHICAACYEVPQQMAEEAWGLLSATQAMSAAGTPAIDLGAGVAQVLSDEGVTWQAGGDCTFENDRFFSHRRQGSRSGRQVGLIWLAE